MVKFLFHPHSAQGNTEVASTHYIVLCNVNEIYPRSKSTTTLVKLARNWENFRTIQHISGISNSSLSNPISRRNAPPCMLYIIRSTPAILCLKFTDCKVSNLLYRANACMTIHLWSNEDTRISNLSFFVRFDPSNHLKSDFEMYTHLTIAKNCNCSCKDIPKFQCGFSSLFLIDENNNQISTKVYNIQ